MKDLPFVREPNPSFDESIYHRAALAAAGRGDPAAIGTNYAPLYPLAFLGAIYRVTRGAPAESRLLQALLYAILPALVLKLARRYAVEPAARAAGVLALLYAPFLVYGGSLLAEPLQILLAVGAALAAQAAIEEPAPRRMLAAGALLGLGILAKPTAAVFVPAAILAFALRRGFRPGPLSRFGGALVLASLVVVSPAAAWASAREGRLVFVRSQAGWNLLLGNHPGADGTMRWSPEGQRIRDEVERANPDPTARDRAYGERVGRFAREHPAEFVRLLGRKAVLFWTPREIPNNLNVSAFVEDAPFLKLPCFLSWGEILPLVLLGLWGRRRDPAAPALPLLMALLLFLAYVPFAQVSRYRLPVEALLLPFAGAALVDLASAARAGARTLRGPLAALALLEVAANLRPIDSALRPLLAPGGFATRSPDGALLVHDELDEDSLSWVALLGGEERLRKVLLVDAGPRGAAEAALIVRGRFWAGWRTPFLWNGREVLPPIEALERRAPSPGRDEAGRPFYPAELRIPIPPDSIRRGENVLEIRGDASLPIAITLRTRYDFDRSWVLLRDGPSPGAWRKDRLDDRTYRSLRGAPVGDGEFAIRLWLRPAGAVSPAAP